jgi:hypothetical protein
MPEKLPVVRRWVGLYNERTDVTASRLAAGLQSRRSTHDTLIHRPCLFLSKRAEAPLTVICQVRWRGG